MASPLLPWEVLERIIGHSGDDPRTLHNFSLTCRSLRPRALCLLVSDVRFKSRAHIFDFCDVLRAKPHLKPLVRSVAMSPDDLAPFPLLSILPNLSNLELRSPYSDEPRTTVLNRPCLTCCKLRGTQIQALHLIDIQFPTLLDFARVLLAFSNLTDLICYNVSLKARDHRGPLDHVLGQRLLQRLHLLNIDIDFMVESPHHFEMSKRSDIATFLLDSGLVESTVETLTTYVYRSNGLGHHFSWAHLQSLVLKLRYIDPDAPDAVITFLRNFSYSPLKNVAVELHGAGSIIEINRDLRHKELEQALLQFSRPQVAYFVDYMRDARTSFWIQETKKHFPVLFQRGSVTLTPRVVIPGVGHEGEVQNIATSPDGRWVATASHDFTVILWDASNGAIAQQWVSCNYDYRGVPPLVFSPDSRYLVFLDASGADMYMWDLVECSRRGTPFEGRPGHITYCAWSPRGDIIASCDGPIVRLWNARTFHSLHVLQDPEGSHIGSIEFSPDGRWLVCKHDVGYHVWNVASGMLHKPFKLPDNWNATVFVPGSTRVVAFEDNRVKIVEIETGEELAVWDPEIIDDRIKHVAISPDGTLVVLVTSSDNKLQVKLWDTYTGVERAVLLGGQWVNISQACFSPCGKYVALASDMVVWLCKVSDGSRVATFSEHNASVDSVAFCPDGQTLWSGDEEGAVVMRRIRDILPTASTTF